MRSHTSICKAPSQLFSDQLQNVRKSQTLIGISDKALNVGTSNQITQMQNNIKHFKMYKKYINIFIELMKIMHL